MGSEKTELGGRRRREWSKKRGMEVGEREERSGEGRGRKG